MRPHNQGQLDWVRGIAETQRTDEPEHAFELDEIVVWYTTVHLRDDQKPFDFAVAAAVLPRVEGAELEYAIAVSDDVPEELRGYWAWHELNDFAELGHETENRCLISEVQLANSVGSHTVKYALYLIYRIPFYEKLIEYIRHEIDTMGDGTPFSVKDWLGAKDALLFLKSMEVINNTPADDELL